MAKERDIGTPTWQKSSKRWRLSAQRNGERKWFYSSIPGRRGQRECEDKAVKRLSADPNSPTADPLVADVYAEWVQETLETTSANQARDHESFGRLYILPSLGKLHVSGLKNEQQLQKIINGALKAGAQGKGLAKKTLTTLKGVLCAFVKYGRKRGLTTLHPENLVVPRRARGSDKKILQPADLRKLFSCDYTRPRYSRERLEWFIHAFRLQVLTGMRPGEVLGLSPEDITGKTIRVQRSWSTRGEWTDGKNMNAHRTLPITSHIRTEINAQIETLRQAGLAGSHCLFPVEDGEPASHRTYRKHLITYCAFNDMTIVSPYELHHTFISLNSFLPVEAVKQVAGHSQAMDAFGVYGHDVNGRTEQIAGMLDKVMREVLDES